MTTETDAISMDPFNSGTAPYLSGIKLAAGYNTEPVCPKPLGTDTVKSWPWLLSAGTQFKGAFGIRAARDQRVKMCEYRSTDPNAAISAVLPSMGPADYQVCNQQYSKWYSTDNTNSTIGCKVDDAAYVIGARYPSIKDPRLLLNQVFPWADKCPTWSKDTGIKNLNTDCKGATVKTCSQSIGDIVDCCMGRKSGPNCRSDQKPQSTSCDRFMREFCSKNPEASECKCLITPAYSDSEKKIFQKFAGIIIPKTYCNYPPCVQNINDAYQTDTMLKDRPCPANNICSLDIDSISFIKGAIGNKVDIKQDCPAPITNINSTLPKSKSVQIVPIEPMTATEKLRVFLLTNQLPLSIGSALVFVILVALVFVYGS